MTLQQLNSHITLLERFEKAKEILQLIKSNAYPKSPILTGMPPCSTGISDKVGNLGIEIAYMEAKIACLSKEIKTSEEKIVQWLNGIDDERIKLAFRLKFLRGMPWREVASIFGSTEESIKKICYRHLSTTEIQRG